MILYGSYTSPFVRLIAPTLKSYNLKLANIELKTSHAEQLSQLKIKNASGRVPTFETDQGELIIDSLSICDYLDRFVGSERSLISADFGKRTRVMTEIDILSGVRSY